MRQHQTILQKHRAISTNREVELAWLKAEYAKNDLIEFACRIDPTQCENYRAPHLRIIADKLEAVERGECKRLHITAPPRHWKTSTAVEKFAIYYLAKHPERTVAVISHSASNALDFSRTIRNTILFNPLFQKLFPNVKVNPNQTAAGEWALEGSFRASLVAMSTGASPTGRGFHCLLGDTVVNTEYGPRKMNELTKEPMPCKVLGYDERRRRLVFRKIQGISCRAADGFYRISTASGRMVEATGEHPFFTGDGYKEASAIAPGDNLLLALPEEGDSSCIRSEKVACEGAHENVLLKSLLGIGGKQAQREIRQAMRVWLWGQDNLDGEILQRIMQGEGGIEKGRDGSQGSHEGLFELWEAVSSKGEHVNVLQQGVCGGVAFADDVGAEEPWLEGGGGLQADAEAEMDTVGEVSARSGQDGVCGLRQDDNAPRSSRGFGLPKQSPGESCYTVQESSRKTAWRGAFRTQGDVVAVVERVCSPCVVWNLQVEGTQNYFANDVLTHNCIMIDDPTPDVQAALNKKERDRQWAWYREVLRDRLEPGGAMTLIMSRWHQDDLAGRLLKESASGDGEPWDVVHLKALNDAGEALWPERWPVEELLRIKKAQGARAFAARFQGEPRLEEETMLDSTKLKMVGLDDVPRFIRVVRHWDLAFSDRDGADYAAGCKMGITESGWRYILHIRRVHGRWTSIKPIIFQMAQADGVECSVAIEANGTQLGYAQDIKEQIKNRHVIEHRPEGNKEMRAAIWGSRLEDGIIYCVRGEWNQEFMDECVRAGTEVITMRGLVPIEAVAVGDRVLTRAGWNCVQKSELTSVQQSVTRIGLGNGCYLEATRNHPVFVLGSGFIQVKNLKVGQRVLWLRASSVTQALSSFDTQRAGECRSEIITRGDGMGAKRICIGSSMSSALGRSLRAMWSIIRTLIPATTPYRILSAWGSPSICGCIGNMPQPANMCVSNAGQGFGLRARTVLCGALENVLMRRGLFGGREGQGRVAGVRRSSTRSGHTSSAAQSVAASDCRHLSALSQLGNVSSVEKHFPCDSDLSSLVEGVAVTSLDTVEGGAVYNLMVEGCPEYFANGILVHNCAYFPNGEHDDMVDAVSGAWAVLAGGAAFSDASGFGVDVSRKSNRPQYDRGLGAL